MVYAALTMVLELVQLLCLDIRRLQAGRQVAVSEDAVSKPPPAGQNCRKIPASCVGKQYQLTCLSRQSVSTFTSASWAAPCQAIAQATQTATTPASSCTAGCLNAASGEASRAPHGPCDAPPGAVRLLRSTARRLGWGVACGAGCVPAAWLPSLLPPLLPAATATKLPAPAWAPVRHTLARCCLAPHIRAPALKGGWGARG